MLFVRLERLKVDKLVRWGGACRGSPASFRARQVATDWRENALFVMRV